MTGICIERAPRLASGSRRMARAALAAFVAIGAGLVPSAASAQQSDWPAPIHDGQLFWFVLVDQLEIQPAGDSDPVVWDVEGWIGGDFNRIWLKSEGEKPTRGGGGEFEVQALFSHLIAPFWEAQAGVRYDRQTAAAGGQSRAHLVLGFQGLAPYWFHLEPALFLSEDGDLSGRVTASYDLLLSQRLVLQPEIETNFAAQTVEEWGVGAGLSDLSVDFRLRYEFRREIAPYLGIGWSQRFGRTADLARAHGEPVAGTSILGGVRIWF